MRAVFLMAMLAATPAMACNADLLAVEKWSAEKSGDVTFDLTLTMTPKFPQGVRMIDAQANFSDRLGGWIGGVIIDRDTRIGGATFTQVNTFGIALDLARLLRLPPEDVVVSSCVRAVIYEDGSREDF